MASIAHAAGRTEIRFDGTIDHRSAPEFARLFAELQKTVCLNFREVSRIDSYGVGLLMRHLAALAGAHEVELAECSETMVDQFQMLNFSRYARIVSFQARYACAKCERLDTMLLDVRRDLRRDGNAVVAPSFPCTCGGRLEVDDSLEFVIAYMP